MPNGDSAEHDNNTASASELATADDSPHGHDTAVNGRHTNGSNGLHKTTSAQEQDVLSNGTPRGPPSKRRKLDGNPSIDPTRTRRQSPPWKKFTVDGPTSFKDTEGRRKSSRVNAPPAELQPGKGERRTRASHPAAKSRPSYADLHNGRDAAAGAPPPPSSKSKKAVSPTKPSPSQAHFKVPQAKKPQKRGESPEPRLRSNSNASIAQGVTEKNGYTPQQATEPQPARKKPGRKSARVLEAERAQERGAHTNGWHESAPDVVPAAPDRSTRIKLRLRAHEVEDPGILHPLHVPQPKKFASFSDWVNHDQSWEGDEEPKLTTAAVKREAAIRLRLLNEAQEGGLLHSNRALLFADTDPVAQEPPRRYGHFDHVVNHALDFHKRMTVERERHRRNAKEMAIWCRDELANNSTWEWLRMPLDREETLKLHGIRSNIRYKQVVQDMKKRWELVREEVNRLRRAKWEEDQQAMGKKALDEMLDQSTQLLTQRRLRRDSEVDSQEDEESYDEGTTADQDDRRAYADEFEGFSGDDGMSDEDSEPCEVDHLSDLDSDVMSGSGYSDDEDAGSMLDEDAELDQEALRQKYADALERVSSNEGSDAGSDAGGDTGSEQSHDGTMQDVEDSANVFDLANVNLDEVDPMLLDDSDHSTDMEDDIGSTDDSTGSESGSQDDGHSQSEEEEENPLWGFLSKAERERLKEEAADTIETDDSPGAEAELRDADSALPEDSTRDPSQVGTPRIAIADAGMSSTGAPSKATPTPSMTDTPDLRSDLSVIDKPTPQLLSRGSSTSRAITPATPRQFKIDVPSLFRGVLREYQHQGLDWLAGLYGSNTNGILADEMGLGKTIQTIVLLAHLAVHHEVWGPHLVVVPNAVMYNWEMEFKRFCPGFKVLVYEGDQEVRKLKRKGWSNDDMWNVVITSYNLVVKDAQAFKKRSWHYLILDEAHAMKNFQTQRWQTMLNLRTNARLLLTGTPLQNNLQELWSLLYFLMPSGIDGQGGFADLDKFINAVKRPADQILDKGMQKLDAQAQMAVNKLHKVLRPYLLRRLKADVEKQMPAKYEHVVYCRLSKRQRQLYDEFMGRADTKQSFAGGNYISIMNCLMSLRKVCNHPDLFETRPIKTSFAMPRSAIADFEIKELMVRKRFVDEEVSLDHLGFLPVVYEKHSRIQANRWEQLDPTRQLEDIVIRQSQRIPALDSFGTGNMQDAISYATTTAKLDALDQIRHAISRCKKWSQRKPLYGTGLHKRLSLGFADRPFPRPSREIMLPTVSEPYKDFHITDLVSTLQDRATSMETTIQKFACVTPAVVAEELVPISLTPEGVNTVQRVKDRFSADPFHEYRIRLSIAFPDKRLLQWDCGKLQKLDRLLRDLQSGGHRALIFSGMTRTLDILEQFLNIHGHRYLRLDGSTKPQQRQDMVDRFNNDIRIPVFILSARAGGLGINLTGADTVIFYDMDWNPAWDKQCQDRAHRIGQTRDVHIYRFVSEYTIEANILRKSNQKRLLDEVIIQKGDFTTDSFNRVTYKDALDDSHLAVDDDEAGAAMDRLLGGDKRLGGVLENVEDKEDVDAAKKAMQEEREIEAQDDEEATEGGEAQADPIADRASRPEMEEYPHVDDYMLRYMKSEMMSIPLAPPPGRRRDRKGRDHGRRR